MTAALAPFDFQGQQVRVVTDEHGEPAFVAADVAAVLNYRMASDMTRTLDPEDMGTRLMRTPSGEQVLTVVTEAGLYAAILGRQTGRIGNESTRERIGQFKRWVTHDVLPEIRKTGGYGATPALPDITTAAGVLAMAEQFAATARALVESEAKVAELEPKADMADTFLIADKSDRLVREAAKLVGMKERDLRRFLLEQRLIYTKHARCGDIQYDFYAANAHYFTAREKVVDHQWGSCSHYTLFITARGMELLLRRLRNEGVLAVAS